MRVITANVRQMRTMDFCKQGDYRYHDVNMPHYRKKGGMFNLIMSTNAFVIKNGFLYVSMSRNFKALHPEVKEIKIAFPKRLEDKTIKEVRILPCNNGKWFKVQYVYEVSQEVLDLDTRNALAIDLGIDIINYCIENDIGTLIVGYNADFKRNSNIGKTNNQNFVQIPLGDLRRQLQFLCWKYGIEYLEQEESYTSKSSFLDNDIIPEYKPEQPYMGTFSGKRVHRGLYKSKNGTLINADVNGSANILRKCKQNLNFEKLYNGLLASPQRIRLS